MSVSSVGSSNPYAYPQWPAQSGVDSTDQSGSPSDPLLALFNAATGGAAPSDPLLASQSDDDASEPGSSGPCSAFSPETMSTLISAQGQQGGSSGLQSVLGQFDTDHDGKISKSEFEQAIGPNADKSKVDELFSALDGNDDGSVSQDELSSSMQKARAGHHRHHHHAASQSSQATDPLSQMLSGTTQPDDGSVGATSAASSSASSNPFAASLQAMLEKMIGAQAQMFAAPSGMDVTV